jgi:SAM-dependent methyltransferase
MCDAGLTGIGVDFSERALEIAGKTLDPYIQKGQYRLQPGDVHDLPADFAKVDIAISYMVMEHVEDDIGFVRKIAQYVKPGGTIIIAVPGRHDRWSLEDETVGHLRRYDRGDLDAVLRKATLSQVSVWSVGVPTINLLFNISLWMVARSAETAKVGLSLVFAPIVALACGFVNAVGKKVSSGLPPIFPTQLIARDGVILSTIDKAVRVCGRAGFRVSFSLIWKHADRSGDSSIPGRISAQFP